MQIQVLTERQASGGTEFEIQVGDSPGNARRITLRLSWADYNLWSPDGSDPPQHVAAAAVRFLLQHVGLEQLPERLDASSPRRKYPDADRDIPRLIES